MIKIKKIILSFFIVCGFLYFFTSKVEAGPFDYPVVEGFTKFIEKGKVYGLEYYIGSIYKIALWMVGISALLMISIGAFMYITSAGNNASMQTAKEVIADAIIGLILAFLAWLILYIINPSLVMININFPPQNYAGKHATVNGAFLTNDVSLVPSDVPGQSGDASQELKDLISCMQEKVPSGKAFVISSISDGNGGVNCYQDHPDWPQCSGNLETNCCFHKKGSCHYGGTCGGSSYAVDFSTRKSSLSGDEMISLAKDCNANYTKDEGNHIHVSVGANCGCK